MALHDPFWFIFHYLRLNANPSQIPLIREKMQEIQETFREGRFDHYNYSDPLFQAAYLIKYFPLYIDIIDDLLTTVQFSNRRPGSRIRPELEEMENKRELEVTLYGGGPEPELLGLMKFMMREFPSVQEIRSNHIDINDWDRFREFSHKFLAHYYWGKESVTGSNIRLDLCNLFEDHDAMERVRNSDIHIMQHCATDLMYSFESVDRYQQFLQDLYDQIKPGAFLIGIDVPVNKVLLTTSRPEKVNVGETFLRFVRYSENCPGTCIVSRPNVLAPRELTPTVDRSHRLVHYFPLKRSVKYHSFVVKKGR